MADVRPLHGLRYAHEHINDLSQVVTPPFDVISQDAQERYYKHHPYNVIRLEFGKGQSDDNTLNNVYTRAAVTLAEWRLQGILYQEAEPCYYFYQQTFRYEGQTYTRTSLMARVRLEPWEARVVLPHENTLARAKEDRLRLLRACATNLSPIMCLYDDPQKRIKRLFSTYASEAQVQFVDEAGVEHRLHPLADRQCVALIQDFFAQRQLYIADGHHRYTTALNYRDEVVAQRKASGLEDSVNFMFMALVDVEDPGMLVLPTHRLLVGLSQDMLQALSSSQLAHYFVVQQLDRATPSEELFKQLKQAGEKQPSLIIYLPEHVLLLSVNEDGKRVMEESEHSVAWQHLDVAIAQQLILKMVLGLSDDDIASGSYIRYSHEGEETLQAVQRGEAQAAILLNATPLRQVCDVAQADDRMPQKSTYLYPKLITGLVMNPLW